MNCFIDQFEHYKDSVNFLTTVGLFIIGFLINRRARRIQRLMVFKEFREPLVKFANEAIDVMSEAEGLSECNPSILGQDFFNRYNQILTKISSLRDKGKLYIPNNFPKKYGTEKATAYQGFRHEALDCLTAAYYAAGSLNFKSEGYNKKSITLEPDDSNLQEQLNSLDSKSEDFKLLKQAQKIKLSLDKLPTLKDKNGNLIIKDNKEIKYSIEGPKEQLDNKFHGWSSKEAIIETKRRFVSIIQELIRARYWGEALQILSEPNKDESPS